MSKNPLQVVEVVDHKSSKISSKKRRRIERQAIFDRKWLDFPEEFTPSEIDKLHNSRLITLLKKYEKDFVNKKIIDLGCGQGDLSRKLRDLGGQVSALDVSQNALKKFKEIDSTGIHLIHDFIPDSLLEDYLYDIVVASDLIAYLEKDEYRIFFSELARISKMDAHIVVSSSIDIHSEDAIQRLAALASTELDLEEWSFSYHYLFIKLMNFLKFPSKVLKAAIDSKYKEKSLAKRYAFSKWWFKINSISKLSFLWKGVNFLFKPLSKKMNNQKLILFLEKVSKSLFNEKAISHAILIGKKKRLLIAEHHEGVVTERKHKKQVWE